MISTARSTSELFMGVKPMSEIEIPKEFKAAWHYAATLADYPYAGTMSKDIFKLADLAVFLLAGWMRSEFYHIHAQHELNCRVFECHTKADPRHTWTDDQWLAAARARLEERDG